MNNEEAVDMLMRTLEEYVQIFSDKLHRLYICRYTTTPTTIYMDYYVKKSSKYSEGYFEDALAIFNIYVDILIEFFDENNVRIQYELKDIVKSSEVIGKSLYITDFSYKLPYESEEWK